MVSKRSLAEATIDTRSRVVVAALRCFSRRGFAGTSLAHIESEAGLSPGAGSTYRYFASKRAMLEAAVEHAVARADDCMRPAPATLQDAARMSFAGMDELRDLTRIVLRDLDEFPEVLMPVVDRLLEGPIRNIAAQLAEASPGVDGEAMATLLIGALVNVKVIEAVAGVRPGVVDEHRLVDAWAHLYGLVVENAT